MQSAQSTGERGSRARVVALGAITIFLLAMPALAAAATLDQIRAASKITLGYRDAAPPFSYRDEAGKPAGYSVALCEKIVGQIKSELGLAELTVEWVPLTPQTRFQAVTEGKVDLLCGVASVTLGRRQKVAFSLPVFEAGIGAVLRADSSYALRQLLAEGQPPAHPIWRGEPARAILEKKTASVVTATTSEAWLAARLTDLQLDLSVVPVDSYQSGIRRVLDGTSDIFFGDQAILLDEVKRSPSAKQLVVLNRQFTYEPIALALRLDDSGFQLLVDRTLSHFYRTKEFRDLYAKWFGALTPDAERFFLRTSVPD